MRNKSFLMVAVIVSICLFSISALSQQTTGALSGTVMDPNGRVVAGATVVATNEATGVATSSFTTGSEGTFQFNALNPGNYSVTTTTASGFKKKTITGIPVRLGQDTPIRVGLEVGGASESVTIVASADEIAQVTSEQSSNFDKRKVSDLPSNAAGGGIDTLALNIPGVVPGFGNVNSNGSTLSVNGNRARSNNFTIDGTDNNDLSIGGPSFFVTNTEIVQEFQVVTNNFSAQYGRNQGAIVNIITKGGTNQFSGSFFEYHRNASRFDAMTNIEARDPTRSARDKFISNTFGGTIGGPIVKNKAFFFGSTEFIRQFGSFTALGTGLAILPSQYAALNAANPGSVAVHYLTTYGAFALSAAGNVKPRNDGTFLPENVTINGVQYAAAYPSRYIRSPFTQKEFTGRGDWNASDKDNLRFQLLWQDSVNINAGGASNGFTYNLPARSYNFSNFWNRTLSSHALNSFQGTFQRLSVKFGGCPFAVSAGCIPDPSQIADAFANVTFGGVRGVVTNRAGQTIGGATNLPQGRIVDVYQFSDKVAWIVGNHNLNIGADVRYLKNNVPFLPNINGVLRFSTAASVTNGVTSANGVTLANGTTNLAYTQFDRFFFFQDDWRVTSRLTLNLGARYEYSGQPINRLYDVTNARESNPATAFYLQTVPLADRIVPKLKADSNNFAPRLGFALSLGGGTSGLSKFMFGGKDATVIRGGFSIAYDAVFYNILLNISSSAPTVITDTFTSAVAPPAFPTGIPVRAAYNANIHLNALDPRLLAQTIVSSNFHSPYSEQYSVGFQRQINDSNVFEMRYVGNKGKSLFQTINGNPRYDNLYNGFTVNVTENSVVTPETFPAFATLTNGAPAPQVCVDNPVTTFINEGACNGRLLAGRGLIRSRTNTGHSAYDSLQMRYNGRFLNKNLNLGVAYTWSKALDNASEVFSFGEIAIAQNPFDVNTSEYGLSGNNRPQSFSANVIYDFPWHKDQTGFAGKILGGWQINATYNLASGRPYTPLQVCNVGCGTTSGGATYQDNTFTATFFGQDNLKPFNGNVKANPQTVGIFGLDARLIGFINSTTAFVKNQLYSMAGLNQGLLVPVTMNDVRLIFNGPEAAKIFGTPFGNVGRNTFVGPKLNQLNMGVFKTTNLGERVRVQLRAEAFNVLNHPNSGFGVAAGTSLPDTVPEDAGSTFANFQEIALSSRRLQFAFRILF